MNTAVSIWIKSILCVLAAEETIAALRASFDNRFSSNPVCYFSSSFSFPPGITPTSCYKSFKRPAPQQSSAPTDLPASSRVQPACFSSIHLLSSLTKTSQCLSVYLEIPLNSTQISVYHIKEVEKLLTCKQTNPQPFLLLWIAFTSFHIQIPNYALLKTLLKKTTHHPAINYVFEWKYLDCISMSSSQIDSLPFDKTYESPFFFFLNPPSSFIDTSPTPKSSFFSSLIGIFKKKRKKTEVEVEPLWCPFKHVTRAVKTSFSIYLLLREENIQVRKRNKNNFCINALYTKRTRKVFVSYRCYGCRPVLSNILPTSDQSLLIHPEITIYYRHPDSGTGFIKKTLIYAGCLENNLNTHQKYSSRYIQVCTPPTG